MKITNVKDPSPSYTPLVDLPTGTVYRYRGQNPTDTPMMIVNSPYGYTPRDHGHVSTRLILDLGDNTLRPFGPTDPSMCIVLNAELRVSQP